MAMQKIKFVLWVTLTSGIINLIILYLQPLWFLELTRHKYQDPCNIKECFNQKKKTHFNQTNNLYNRRIQKNMNREKLKFNVKVCYNAIVIIIADIQLINDTKEGLHVFVFNQATGSYMAQFHQKIQTIASVAQENLKSFLDSIQDGRILIFVYNRNNNIDSEDEFQLSDLHISLSIYSSNLVNIENKDLSIAGWIMLSLKGVGKIAEIIEKSSGSSQRPAPCLYLKQSISLSQEMAICPNWENSRKNNAKRRLCRLLEGYKSLCSCEKEDQVPEFQESVSYIDIPIIIISINDPHYLLRTLTRLTYVFGINHNNILVFKDYHFEETKLIGDLFDIKMFKIKSFNSLSSINQLSYKYRVSVSNAFRFFKNHQYLIFIEDNVDVTSDFLVYFNQTQSLLDSSQNYSTFCIAGSSNEQKCQSNFLEDVYYGENFPSRSFMLSRDTWVNQLNIYWPDNLRTNNWRQWVSELMKQINRPCTYPIINRENSFEISRLNVLQTLFLNNSLNYSIKLNHLKSEHLYVEWLDNCTKFNLPVFSFSFQSSAIISRIKRISEHIELSINCYIIIHGFQKNHMPMTNKTTVAVKVPMVTSEDTRKWREIQKCLNLSIQELESCWYKNSCFLCLGNKKLIFFKSP